MAKGAEWYLKAKCSIRRQVAEAENSVLPTKNKCWLSVLSIIIVFCPLTWFVLRVLLSVQPAALLVSGTDPWIQRGLCDGPDYVLEERPGPVCSHWPLSTRSDVRTPLVFFSVVSFKTQRLQNCRRDSGSDRDSDFDWSLVFYGQLFLQDAVLWKVYYFSWLPV